MVQQIKKLFETKAQRARREAKEEAVRNLKKMHLSSRLNKCLKEGKQEELMESLTEKEVMEYVNAEIVGLGNTDNGEVYNVADNGEAVLYGTDYNEDSVYTRLKYAKDEDPTIEGADFDIDILRANR